MEIITLAEHGLKSGKDFTPHMMYHPKTGKGEMANKPEDHIRLDKKGYVHDKKDVKKESIEIDERALCHSKTHDCATVVFHEEYGIGKPLYEKHAIPTDDGYVAWYDVEFKHGIEEKVYAKDMVIEAHNGHESEEPKTPQPSKEVPEVSYCIQTRAEVPEA